MNNSFIIHCGLFCQRNAFTEQSVRRQNLVNSHTIRILLIIGRWIKLPAMSGHQTTSTQQLDAIALVRMVRTCLAALSSFLLLSIPVAEARHVEAAHVETCDASGETHIVHDHDDVSHDHQHAHHCSSCHLYIVLKEQIPSLTFVSLNQAKHEILSEELIIRPPGTLYRPPKA